MRIVLIVLSAIWVGVLWAVLGSILVELMPEKREFMEFLFVLGAGTMWFFIVLREFRDSFTNHGQ